MNLDIQILTYKDTLAPELLLTPNGSNAQFI